MMTIAIKTIVILALDTLKIKIMGFTTPCFIRKNTPEIRKKLEELGYKDYGSLRFYGEPIIIYCNANHFFTSPFVLEGEQYRGKYDKFIDCGDNEYLFLAVAALRNDTDSCQWFTDGIMWEMVDSDLPSHYMQLEGHKASLEELINFFK